MRLTAIKLAGFKSFVEPTTLSLPGNLTAVVGPNGSGKSNIIDAIRWVLGESGAKNLRGTEREDVIFAGSRLRKPGGRASVEMLFDNSQGRVPGPYQSYAEIAIRRELVRGGDSQYYLNGSKCLRRDVVDLFLGTGLGGRSQYSILEQGTIQRLVDAKPEELRLWVEEAAGISRYRDRRRETENRIRATRDNLARLGDLRGEIGQRLTLLERQAADAERYRQLMAEQRRLRIEVLLLRRRGFESQYKTQQAALAALEAELEQARGALAGGESRVQLAQDGERDLAAAHQAEQAAVYRAEAELARCEQALTHAREMTAMRRREAEQLTGQLGAVEQRIQRERQTLAQARQARIEANGQVEGAVADLADAEARLRAAESELEEAQMRWEAFQASAERPLVEVAGERARRDADDSAARSLEEREARLRREQAQLVLEPLERRLVEHDAALADADHRNQALSVTLAAHDQQLAALRDRRAALDAALHEMRAELQDVRGRQASLETLQQAALRSDDPAMRQWLGEHGLDDLPRLASQLQVDEGWDIAVEQVLGGWLSGLLMPGSEAIDPSLRPPADLALVSDNGGSATAGDRGLALHVRGPAALRALLATVRVARDLGAAREMQVELAGGETVVTPDGVWLGAGWCRYPGQESAQGGVIARGVELRRLRQRMEQLGGEVEDQQRQLETLEAESRNESDARGRVAAELDALRRRHALLQTERRETQVRLEQMQSRRSALDQELDGLRQQRSTLEQTRHERTERLARLEQEEQELRAGRTAHLEALQRARSAVQVARERAQTLAQTRSQAAVRAASQASAVEAAERLLAELESQLQALRQRRATEQVSEASSGADEGALAAAAATAREALTQARDRLRQARETLNTAEREAEAARRALGQLRDARDQIVERLQRQRLESENLRARDEVLSTQIAEAVEESGLDADAVAAELDSAADMQVWEQKQAQTQRRLDRLGAINLAAIGELEEARARAAELDAQNEDLEQALATLEDAMRKLDRETEQLFRSTFERLAELFGQRARQLFGGGEALLELTGDDLLTTGVRVTVRPPGKRNTSIQMLSGGEKSLAALALLFALFALNPAPFCLLDEVEAPLDDANVVRFCDTVREMSESVQFIIITHNKITMELSSHLHGVTMQEPGVSRLVSVDIERALALAENGGDMTETADGLSGR